jgi:hypothetical protein
MHDVLLHIACLTQDDVRQWMRMMVCVLRAPTMHGPKKASDVMSDSEIGPWTTSDFGSHLRGARCPPPL